MSIRKKILATSIGPVLVLGVITLLFMLTMVKSSLMDEVQDALKGTAAATLAAYDQNTGDYLESTNGDIWKGSYNISKSESLVDRIKENTGMDVTFFYGNKRIMTSALDKKRKPYPWFRSRGACGETGDQREKAVFQYKCFTRWDEKLWIFYSGVSEWNDRSGYRYGVCRNQ